MIAATYARARSPARFAPAAEPNVIPFIDVLLVLLIIFMVTAPKPTVDLQLELAAGGHRAIVIEPTVVSLRHTSGGDFRVFVGEQETTIADLPARALALVATSYPALDAADIKSEATIYVRSDQDVAYAHVVAAIDELQNARFAQVSVIAQRADDE